jgi:hypothetical protein
MMRLETAAPWDARNRDTSSYFLSQLHAAFSDGILHDDGLAGLMELVRADLPYGIRTVVGMTSDRLR